ncbi:MAG: hypothetical protein Q8R17_02845 [bacterium]|nr:hypothetical protein [bacterium]
MNKKTVGLELAVLGAGIAGLAAGAYFFFGPKGKKHQRHTKAWAIKMKGDVVAKLERAKAVTKPLYHQIIDSVAKKYEKGMQVSRDEVHALAADLKKHWKILSREI